MHRHDVMADIRRVVKHGTDVWDDVARRESYSAPVVNVDKIWRRRGYLVVVECGVNLCHERPRVCMGGCFAGEVAGVEFFKGGVEVVGVELDTGRRPIVGADLDDAE